MKSINKFLAIALLAITFGCNDAIDIRQVGRLDAANAFQTVGNLQDGLIDIYGRIDITPEIALSANFTDEVTIGFDSGGQGQALYNFNLNAGSAAASNFWTRNFFINQRINVLFEAASLIDVDPADQADYNNILGQIHFLRAWVNTEMILYFSPDPSDDSTLAVPLIDFVPGLSIQPRRDTTGELWDFVEADLTAANNLISANSSTLFASKDAIKALRARIALTRGDLPTAGTLAQQLINAYPLANRTQYANMYLDSDNTEIIWKLERTVNDNFDGQGATGSVNAGGWAGARFAFVTATLDGSPYFEMDRGLFNLLDPNDIRYDVNVSPTSIIDPDYETSGNPVQSDILVIQKYPGSEGKPLMNDLKVFRSSEMVLILAEVRARQNNLSGAADLVDDIRDARFGSDQVTPVYGSQAEALAGIMDERRIELAFEGHRMKDLKRVGPIANLGIDRDPIDCGVNSAPCTLPATDFRFALPIPIVEINANPGIAEQQNPGY